MVFSFRFAVEVLVVTIVLINESHALLESPCPDVFVFEPLKSKEDRWYGLITLKSKNTLDNFKLEIHFDKPVIQLGNWLGTVKSNKNHKKFIIETVSTTILPNKPLETEIFVIYNPEDIQPPKLVNILLDGSAICPKSSNNELVEEDTKPGNIHKNDTKIKIEISSHNVPSIFLNSNQSKCGRVTVRSVSLITHGQETEAGQWPWHAALYGITEFRLSYRCGGSLISEKYVLSAAHCLSNRQSSDVIAANSLMVILGKQTFKEFSINELRVNVSQVIVHPNYNHTNFFNDIGVLKLKFSVKFTNYIQPICLWEDDIDLTLVSNKIGIVVGWGLNENREYNENLMQAQMPIVDTLKCIYSNRQFYSIFTFDKNFCAGFLNGTSVCNGDSGGAMVFPRQSTSGTNTIWQVRGIVSNTVPIQGQAICDPNHYVIFTDVAKHLGWLNDVLTQ